MRYEKSILIVTVCLISFMQTAWSSDITLDELKQIVSKEQDLITTAHIIYIREFTSNEPISNKTTGTINDNINESHKNVLTEEDLYFDTSIKMSKCIKTDLRDVNSLMAQYNIPDEHYNKENILTSNVSINKAGMEFILESPIKDPCVFSACILNKVISRGPEFATLGVIPLDLLNKLDTIQSKNVEEDGKTLLSIEGSYKVPSGNGIVNVVIICDPSIGYRFYKIQWNYTGHVYKEYLADDYKNINGIPYPSSYSKRNYDENNGAFKREEKYLIEQAEFGIKLSEDDFKVFVPSNTNITDFSGNDVIFKIGTGRKIGVDEISALAKKKASEKQ